MIKGRRTSPDTGVGSFGNEVTSSSGDDDKRIGVLRWRGGGMFLTLDKDAFPSDGDKRVAAAGELTIDEVGGGIVKVDVSGMVSDGGTCVSED